MSNLVAHAIQELDLLGYPRFGDAEPGVEGDLDTKWSLEIRKSVMDLVTLFAAQGHSGGSAAEVTSLLHRLLQFKSLSPLTDNPAEWHFHEGSWSGGNMWQSYRQSSCFSHDGGKTYHDLNEERRWIRKLKFKLPRPLRQLIWGKNQQWLIHPIHKSKVVTDHYS